VLIEEELTLTNALLLNGVEIIINRVEKNQGCCSNELSKEMIY
jgi:hypothetical protein